MKSTILPHFVALKHKAQTVSKLITDKFKKNVLNEGVNYVKGYLKFFNS